MDGMAARERNWTEVGVCTLAVSLWLILAAIFFVRESDK